VVALLFLPSEVMALKGNPSPERLTITFLLTWAVAANTCRELWQ
jgi:hypothetical protein